MTHSAAFARKWDTMIHSLPFLRDITEKKTEYYEEKQNQLKRAGNEERMASIFWAIVEYMESNSVSTHIVKCRTPLQNDSPYKCHTTQPRQTPVCVNVGKCMLSTILTPFTFKLHLPLLNTVNILRFSQLKTALTLQFKRKCISFSNNKCSVRINWKNRFFQ